MQSIPREKLFVMSLPVTFIIWLGHILLVVHANNAFMRIQYCCFTNLLAIASYVIFDRLVLEQSHVYRSKILTTTTATAAATTTTTNFNNSNNNSNNNYNYNNNNKIFISQR